MAYRHLLPIVTLSMWILPPNNSFKPTPHRGVNSVLCATLHAVAAPLRGGLTQALGTTPCISNYSHYFSLLHQD